jgi:hypothetical protein
MATSGQSKIRKVFPSSLFCFCEGWGRAWWGGGRGGEPIKHHHAAISSDGVDQVGVEPVAIPATEGGHWGQSRDRRRKGVGGRTC